MLLQLAVFQCLDQSLPFPGTKSRLRIRTMSHRFFTLLVGLTTTLLVTSGCSNQSSTEPAQQAESETDTAQNDAAAETKDDAEPAALKIGDVAPQLKLASWVQGEPIDGFQPGHTYVVEFWATWCGPCRANMPHMSEMQEHYQGNVTFIGVTREDGETVARFLDKAVSKDSEQTWREVVTYPLVLDANDATDNAYMKAAGLTGIPSAFVVGPDAHIEWIGHPAAIENESLLDKILAGTWDREAFLARYEEKVRDEQAFRTAMLALREHQEKGEWDKAFVVIDRLIEQNPEQSSFRMLKLSFLIYAQRFEDATELAELVGEVHWDSPPHLNEIAWTLATQESDSELMLQIALRIAKRANELKQDQDPSILDTLARVHYEMGDLDEAITRQKKAVELGEGHEVLQKTLNMYLAQRDGEDAASATATIETQEEAEDSTAGEEQADVEVESSPPEGATEPVAVNVN
jgi:thiol-disulfide isomerase/thioredoxin